MRIKKSGCAAPGGKSQSRFGKVDFLQLLALVAFIIFMIFAAVFAYIVFAMWVSMGK